MKSAYLRVIGAGIALSMVAQPALAAARPVTVLAKVGGTYADREADSERCEQIADTAPVTDLPRAGGQASAMGYGGLSYGMPGYGTIEGAIGSAIAMAIIAQIEIEKARSQAEKFCMSNLGYAALTLTDEEATAWRSVRGARKREWETAFLADPAVGERVAAMRAPAVPALPEYRPEPATQGGLKFDIASMTAAEGPAGAGGVLASGQATRWRTAEVARPFEARGTVGLLTAAPGAVFHQVDYRPQSQPLLRDQGSTWCGPTTLTPAAGAATTGVWCFTHQPNGYTVFRPTGHAWQAGTYVDGPVESGVTAPLALRERAADDLNLVYEIRAAAMTSANVTLEGSVRNGDQSVVLWRQQVTMRKGSSLTLPLWARRLHLQRVDNTLLATMDDLGDGTALRN